MDSKLTIYRPVPLCVYAYAFKMNWSHVYKKYNYKLFFSPARTQKMSLLSWELQLYRVNSLCLKISLRFTCVNPQFLNSCIAMAFLHADQLDRSNTWPWLSWNLTRSWQRVSELNEKLAVQITFSIGYYPVSLPTFLRQSYHKKWFGEKDFI